jgi:hypothetical protein
VVDESGGDSVLVEINFLLWHKTQHALRPHA